MPMVRFTVLTNVKTGESFTAETLTKAERYLGRGNNYIRRHIEKGEKIYDIDGNQYHVKILQPVSMPFKPTRANKGKQQQLCWNCQRSGGLCPWSREFIPIKGWTAEPDIINDYSHDHRPIRTFLISACPMFIQEPPRKPIVCADE